MKMIVAVIKPDKLKDVKKSLYEAGINRFIVNDIFGHSDEVHVIESYRGVEMEKDLKKKIQIQIALNDEYVQKAVDCIMKSASTGSPGDGKVFVLPIESCYRIETGEEGSSAIG